MTYQPNLYTQVKEGLPLVRVGTAIATPLNSLVVLGDGPVKGLADLKGKTIGYSIAGFEEALLGTMLASAGLKPSDVKLVNVNFSLTPSLLSGQVDDVRVDRLYTRPEAFVLRVVLDAHAKVDVVP